VDGGVGATGAAVVGGVSVVAGIVVGGAVAGTVVVGATIVVGAGFAVVAGVVEVAVVTFLLPLPPLVTPTITKRRMRAAVAQATTCFHMAWFRKRRQRFGLAAAASGACPGCGVGPGKSG
jgi:hypothetical protein